MIFEMILLAIIGTIWFFAGYQIIKFLVPEIGLLTAVSLGAMLGEILYLFFVNISSYAVPIFFSSRAVLIGLLIIGVFFWLLNKKNKTTLLLETDKPHLFFLIIIILIIFIFYTINLFFSTEINFDFPFHQPLAATIAEGNFPPRLPFNPDYSVQYHYGIDLLAGSLISVVGVKPWNAFNVLVLWNLFWTFCLAFILGWILSNKNYLAGFFVAIFVFFGGSLRYLPKLIQMSNNIDLNIFKSGLANGYGVQLFHNPSSVALPAVILFFCLVYLIINNNRSVKIIYLAVITGVVAGALALLSEENFTISIGILLILIFFFTIKYAHQGTLRNRYYILWLIIFIGVIAGVFQGGTISDKIHYSSNAQTNQTITQFKLRPEPGFIFWQEEKISFDYLIDFMPLNNLRWPIFLFYQMGSLPFIFPFAFFYIYKKNQPHSLRFIYIFTALMAIAAFTIPIFIEYAAHDIEIARFFGIFKHISSIFLGITTAYIAGIKMNKYKNVIHVGLFVFIIIHIFGVIAYNSSILTSQLRASSWGWRALPSYIKQQDTWIAEEAKKLIPQESKILTTNLITVPVLWGRFAPFADSREKTFTYNGTFLRLFPEPSIEDLHAMNLQYIYNAPFKEKELYGSHSNALELLEKGFNQNYLESHPEWFILIKRWEFSGQTYYLYRVS